MLSVPMKTWGSPVGFINLARHARTGVVSSARTSARRSAKEGASDAPYLGWKGGLPKTFSDALGGYRPRPAQEGHFPGSPTLPQSPMWKVLNHTTARPLRYASVSASPCGHSALPQRTRARNLSHREALLSLITNLQGLPLNVDCAAGRLADRCKYAYGSSGADRRSVLGGRGAWRACS